MLTEKKKELLRKLNALAERGVGGEKETAKKKLEKMLAENGISSIEELDEEKKEYFLFSYNGKHEIKLLKQCVYKVLGAGDEIIAYHSKGTKQKIGYYCTKAQKIEIDLEFDFYRKAFYEELETFMEAFIQKQQIFPPDAPLMDTEKLTEEELRRYEKIVEMKGAIERKTRVRMVEKKD
ncbi:MAG: hypothetical protein LUG93_09160 [Lachnospiraceae bacterium]|nr:hypothetical protein [Lachnospiraceae bacterium]